MNIFHELEPLDYNFPIASLDLRRLDLLFASFDRQVTRIKVLK